MIQDSEKTVICDKFWDDFLIVAKAVKRLDYEADLYDAFDFIRVHMLGGWTILEDSPFIKSIDEEIEREYQRESKPAVHRG